MRSVIKNLTRKTLFYCKKIDIKQAAKTTTALVVVVGGYHYMYATARDYIYPQPDPTLEMQKEFQEFKAETNKQWERTEKQLEELKVANQQQRLEQQQHHLKEQAQLGKITDLLTKKKDNDHH